MGRATASRAKAIREWLDFNPRPPWGGRPSRSDTALPVRTISIHALRGEGDQSLEEISVIKCVFQSTPSVGRATTPEKISIDRITISIHALRGEGDVLRALFLVCFSHISIHALRGEGDAGTVGLAIKVVHFNPRPPWGGRRWLQVL